MKLPNTEGRRRSWTVINFGKYSKYRCKKTLPQLLFHNPDYFFWGHEEKAFVKHGFSQTEVEELYAKATNIKVPQIYEDRTLAEYHFQDSDHSFVEMHLVSKAELTWPNSYRLDVIDMSVPWKHSNYDKSGYNNLLSSLRHNLFGSTSCKMTKKRCEEFFSNDDNFVMSEVEVAMQSLRLPG